MSETQNPAEEPAPGVNEAAHDVLAAEEFAMPAPDPRLHHGPVTLPSDPTGIEVAHDVLAAEEFAMPAPEPSVVQGNLVRHSGSSRFVWIGSASGLLLAILARRLLRRR
ncbi:MAG: hypothetical protein ACR2OB_02765 [Solirubrobacteraceae bacterium]